MKKIILATVFVFLFSSLAYAGNVRGHYRDSNGDGIKDTYVQPHQRTNPNSSRTDNYSYPGNYNPNTGLNTPDSNSTRETYPSNPNPYNTRGGLYD